MHIVHVITGLRQGGAEAMLEKLLHTARAHDPDVTQEVISLGVLGDVGIRLLDAGFKVRALAMRRSPAALMDLSRLVRWLREAPRHSVVQTWLYHADLFGGLAARLAGRPGIVWNLRLAEVGPLFVSKPTRAVIHLCGRLSRLVPRRIVTNARAAVAGHAPYGYDLRQVIVIANGFDTSMFRRDESARASLRRAWGLPHDALAVGMVARMNPQKDHANFVGMAVIVAHDIPTARFVLVGRGVPEDAALRGAIEGAGLADRFVLVGQRQDVAAVMSALDVFCLSSRAEGFPNVLGEAMACETPSVTTDVGDARVLIDDDTLVAPIENAEKLADRVLLVARLSVVERKSLGQRQRARIVAEYDIARIWASYLELYRGLSGEADASIR